MQWRSIHFNDRLRSGKEKSSFASENIRTSKQLSWIAPSDVYVIPHHAREHLKLVPNGDYFYYYNRTYIIYSNFC